MSDVIENMLDGIEADEQPTGNAQQQDSDRADLISAVRSAVDHHRGDEPEPEHEAERPSQQRQARGANGRFQSSKAAAEPASGWRDEIGEMRAALDAHRQQNPNAPPTSFSAQAKAMWDNAPQELRDAILKREMEMLEGREKYAADRENWKQLEDVLAPARATYQAHGIRSDAEAIQVLLGWDRMAREQPVQALHHFLGVNNLNREQLGQMIGILAQRAGMNPQQLGGPSQEQVEQQVQQRVQALIQQTGHQVEAYIKQQVEHGIAQYQQQQQRTERKIRASSASMNGAPHGSAEGPRGSNSGTHFGDVADAVRAALSAHR